MLYKIDSKWKLRTREQWYIDWFVYTMAWILNWKHVINSRKIEPKNIGKINETTVEQQAKLEMESDYKAQLRKGYKTNPDECEQWVKGSWCPAPMLAKTYDPNKIQSWSNDVKGYNIVWKDLIIQPKLDGVRRLFYYDWTTLSSYTRAWDSVPVLEHMKDDLIKFYTENNLIGKYIDWELYVDPKVMSFQELNGILRKENPNDRVKLVQYYVYDVISARIYNDRMNLLSTTNFNTVKSIPSEFINVDNEEQLTKRLLIYIEEYIEQWYEWIMIRQNDFWYEHKRSKSLLKYKQFEDAEFLCVAVNESADWLAWSITVTDDVVTFDATVVCDNETSLELLKSQDVIGKMVTINFFWRSDGNVPRFPRFKAIRNNI